MSCDPKLGGDITFDCTDKPIQGLERKSLLINRSSIDWAAITKDPTGTIITSLPLLAGETAYVVDNIKNLNNATSTFVVGDADNGHKHAFTGRFYNVDAAALANINSFQDEGEFVLITETKYKGSDMQSAFKIFGLDVGMKMSEGVYDANANKGAYTFTLSNEDGMEEPTAFYIWLETDYATTKPRFDAKLAA